jgi:anti-anti-sigma regulatory factor
MSSMSHVPSSHPQGNGLGAYRYFQVHTNGRATVVQLYGSSEYRSLYANELEQDLAHLADVLAGQHVIVDFCRLSHCCTAMIGGLIRLLRMLRNTGGTMVLCGMTAPCRQAFQMLNLEGTVFSVYDSLDEALEKFSPAESAERRASSP